MCRSARLRKKRDCSRKRKKGNAKRSKENGKKRNTNSTGRRENWTGKGGSFPQNLMMEPTSSYVCLMEAACLVASLKTIKLRYYNSFFFFFVFLFLFYFLSQSPHNLNTNRVYTILWISTNPRTSRWTATSWLPTIRRESSRIGLRPSPLLDCSLSLFSTLKTCEKNRYKKGEERTTTQ